MNTIAENIADTRRRIAEAARRAGRDPDAITLVAVTKTVGADKAEEALATGVEDLGESRVQEARAKFKKIGDKARWHMIGPLQTNKAKYCPGLFSLIHSVDRLELIEELSRRAESKSAVLECLLQVNISGESVKSGCDPEEAEELLKAASMKKGVRFTGLMTIPPFSDDPEDSRIHYKNLMELRKELEGKGIEGVSLGKISAGMTNDFEVAIEEGATIVRVGTAIFGERVYK